MTQVLGSRPGIEPAIERQEFSLKPCSRIHGRERWYVDGLKGNERLARAVEVALTGESGIEEAVAAAPAGLEVVPGIEMTAQWEGPRAVHVLGYFVDPANAALSSALERARSQMHNRPGAYLTGWLVLN